MAQAIRICRRAAYADAAPTVRRQWSSAPADRREVAGAVVLIAGATWAALAMV